MATQELKDKFFEAVRTGATMKLEGIDAEIYFCKPTESFIVTTGEIKADGYIPCGYASTAEYSDVAFVAGFESNQTPISPSWRNKYKSVCAAYHAKQTFAIGLCDDTEAAKYADFDTSVVPVGVRKQLIEKFIPHLMINVVQQSVKGNAIRADVKYYAQTADRILDKMTV